MSEIPLNKFEKEQKVIELHKEGKTIRAIAPLVHMSFTPISKIIKTYDKKIQLDKKKENNQQKTKQPKSISSRAFIMFKKGKQIDETKILLDIPYKLAFKYWRQYLKSIRMYDAFEFYQVCRHDLPSLLSINNFIKNNNADGKAIANILGQVKDLATLAVHLTSIKNEIERLKQTKIDYNTRTSQPLRPLGPLPPYYNW